MTLSLLLSILVGVALGVTGAGGGIIAIPVLMFGMQWDILTAGPVALIAIGAGAWVGAFYAYKKGLLNLKAGFVMAFTGMPMTPIGQWLAQQIPSVFLMSLFIFVLLVVATRMWKSAKRITPESSNINMRAQHSSINHSAQPLKKELAPEQHLKNEQTERSTVDIYQNTKTTSNLVFGLIGLIAGLMTGLLSVGGGFIIVPLLNQFSHLTIKQASSTSLLVIAIVSSTGVISAISSGIHYPFPFTLWFTLTVILGLIIGRIISQYLSDYWVQRIFALFLIFIAALMLIQNFL